MDIDERILHEIEEFTWLFERKKYLKCSISCKNMLQLLQGISALNDESSEPIKIRQVHDVAPPRTKVAASSEVSVRDSNELPLGNRRNGLNNAQRHIMRLGHKDS